MLLPVFTRKITVIKVKAAILITTRNMTFTMTKQAPVAPGGPLGALNANKFTAVDTALDLDQRTAHSLRGHLPPAVESLDKQVLRTTTQLSTLPTPLLKHLHLSQLRQKNPTLFFKTIMSDLISMLPLVYTPTVGAACETYSENWTGPEGLYLSIDDIDHLDEILMDLAKALGDENQPQILVVTDGSRILGLGDLGLGGMGISVGKLSLYVAGGGIRPEGCLPVVLDLGTNNTKLLNDPLYLGLRQPRLSLAEAIPFLDKFMSAASKAFPSAVIQHEDFSSDAAFEYLERYSKTYRMFNDDIQGTGSVILGGFFAAAKLATKASGGSLKDHKVVFLGGGSAAVGVAKEMMNFFIMQGLTEDEARERFWLIDTKGLITSTRPDVVAGKLASHKAFFIRNDTAGQEYKTLEQVIDYVKPTALVGLSTTFGAFSEQAVRRMAALNAAPIIFPLSNPTSKCELSFKDGLEWTDGRVLFASGSPYDPIEFKGKHREAGQGNKFLVFPGIGLGAILSGAAIITPKMITASAVALSEALTHEEIADDLLYPRVERIREVSAAVALGVIRQAQKEGVDEAKEYREMDDQALLREIAAKQWYPEYPARASL